jgi:hypothetical protein
METQNERDNAQSKLERKNFDFIVLNSLRTEGAGFRGDTNVVTLIDKQGAEELPLMSKKDVAERIVLKFPDISKAWLLTGEGSMFASHSTAVSQIPFYNSDAETTLSGELSGEPQVMMFVPQVGECDLAMVYNGRAMGKTTPAGTIIFLKKCDVSAIIPGDEYIVVGTKFTALRKVRKAKNSPVITLVAGDRKAFDDMEITTEEVKHLYHVVGKLTVNN